MRETVQAQPSGWNWAYVTGPIGAVVMVIVDTAFIMNAFDDSSYIGIISALGIGVVALVTAYGSGKVGIGVFAAVLASLVAAPLDALAEIGVAVYAAYSPTPADQSSCGCGGVGGPIFLLGAIIIMLIILCVFRLGLSVTVGLLTAWLGVLLSRLKGRTLSAASQRRTAV